MMRSLLVSAAAAAAVATPHLALGQDAPEITIADATILTMRDVVGTVTTDTSVVAGESDGRIVRWEDGLPVAWVRLGVPIRALAAAGEDVIAVGTDVYFVLSPETLRVVDEGSVDGFTACNGGESVWYWPPEATEIRYADASGVRSFAVEDVPYSRARCSLGPESSALVWDDGIDAILLASDGTSLRSPWASQGLPLGAWDGSWQVSAPSPWSAVSTCDDVTLASNSCAAGSPEALAPLIGPVPRRVADARVVRNGIVMQDSAGWSVVVGTRPPSVIRFDHRTLGLTGGPAPAAIVCEALPTRLVARDVLTGAALDSVEIGGCPNGLRRVSGRVIAQHRDEMAVWDDVSQVFVARQVATGSLQVSERWSRVCAGPSWTVERRGERIIGPSCAPLVLADVSAADGSLVALAVCENGSLAGGLRTDGSALDVSALDGSCDDGFRLPSVPGTEREAGGVRIVDGRVVVSTESGDVVVQPVGDAILVHDVDSIWASGSIWDRVVWAAGDTVHSLRDPRTRAVWDEAILRDSIGRQH